MTRFRILHGSLSLAFLLTSSLACSTSEEHSSATTSPPTDTSTQSSAAGNVTGVNGSTPDNNASMGGGTDSPSNENVSSQSVTVTDDKKAKKAKPAGKGQSRK